MKFRTIQPSTLKLRKDIGLGRMLGSFVRGHTLEGMSSPYGGPQIADLLMT